MFLQYNDTETIKLSNNVAECVDKDKKPYKVIITWETLDELNVLQQQMVYVYVTEKDIIRKIKISSNI